ncbi:hypothetical protein [Streptomyces sp. NPDC057280]
MSRRSAGVGVRLDVLNPAGLAGRLAPQLAHADASLPLEPPV